jgi:PAS domain S-box-containing protein
VEGKPITLQDIPDYAKASFGFGEVSPEEILLIPIIYDNQTIGVLELGNFKCFTEEQSVWLNEAARSISVVLRVVLDMSERKRNSEKLTISEKRLELALSGGDLGLWDVNFQTMKTTVNKRWAEILGYTIEEVKDAGSTWREGIHPDDYERVLRIGSDYREGRIHKYEVEYRVLTKQKDVKWVLSKGAIFERDKKGEPIRMVGTVMDITKLKKHV